MADIGVGSRIVERRSDSRAQPSLAGAAPSERARLVEPANTQPILAEWRDLAQRAVEGNAFFHPGFVLAATNHLNEDLRIAVLRDGSGELTGLAPVLATRLGGIAPAVAVWDHDYTPLSVPLADRRDPAETAAAFIEMVAGGGSVVLPRLPLDGPVAGALVDAAGRANRPWSVVDRHERAVLLRHEGETDVRAKLRTKRRKELRREMRRLADLGHVVIESTAEADRVRAGFEEFLALEAAGWKGQRRTALASSVATAEFAREAVFNLSEVGAARIDSIRLNDRPIAVLVSFVAGTTAHTWKITYDEAYHRFSPGVQLMLEAPRGLFTDPRVAMIDSCADANHPMIDHLWHDRMAIGTMVIGPPGGGVVHRLGVAALRGQIEARQVARRIRRRVSG